MRFESFYASFSPSLHPVTHRSFAYSQCHSYVLLLPALLFQLPGLFPSFFSPIGFLWCSHTSYGITLYFLLPLSVSRARYAEAEPLYLMVAYIWEQMLGPENV